MKNLLFSGLSSLLLPLGAYAGPTAGASYQRTYLSSSINASTADLSHTSVLPRDLVDLSGDQLDIQVAHAVRELVIVDEGVAEADKAVLRRALKPGMEMVYISSAAAGLPQLIAALEGHKNLAAIHVVSHAEAGAILLGNSRITAENIQSEVQAFAALHGAVREGGDLLLYGCDLAANKSGEDLLDIISNKTGLDVAASNNLTGNSALDGDWDLEVTRGNIESPLAFSEKSLKDFSSVLAPSGTKTFESWNGEYLADDPAKDWDGFTTYINTNASDPEMLSGTVCGTDLYVSMYGGNDQFRIRSFPNNGDTFGVNALSIRTVGGGTAATQVNILGYQDGNPTPVGTKNGVAVSTSVTAISLTSGITGSFTNIARLRIQPNNDHFCLTQVVFSSDPVITSATYNTATGALVVTGTDFTATVGATNDVDASDFTLTGEGGSTYTLTDTADVEITSATSFTLTLSATDRAAANLIVNKSGTSSTGGTTYNLAGAAGFIAAAASAADLTGNSITATVAAPTVTSATYDASTGALVVTGTNLKKLNGATNEIIANKFTLTGEGGSTYTLTDTANVEISTGTSFTLTLSATDKAAANLILNKNGTLSTDISTYNLAAAEDWNAGADAAVTIADTTGNNVTVSNVAVPAITSATYDASTGVLVVTGTGLLKRSGATNDIVASKFTLTGEGGGTWTMTDTANVEITSGTSFTLTLSATDKNGINLLLNKNGTSSLDATTYNLAAAEDWAAGADAAVVIADITGNGITTSNAPTAPGAPTIGTATAGDAQATVTFTAPGSNGGSAITTYTATASPGGATGNCAGPAACTITVGSLTNGTAYTFTVTATNAIGTGSASGASNSVTPKADQAITFAQPGNYNFGATPNLSATSDSGLTVSFSSSTTGVCTVTSGGALTFVTAGTCTIDADQAGNSATNAATTVTRSFTVNAIVPDAPTIGTATAGDQQATVTFTAPASMGGAAISPNGYTVTANPGGHTEIGSSSPITVTGLTNGVSYTFTVTATNSAGTGAASANSNAVTPAAPQTITFANPGSQNFGTSPDLRIVNGGASATSGLDVTFTSSTTGVCTVTSEGVLTFLTVGTCTINADQAGNSSYLAATQVSRSFTVNAIVPGAPTSVVATPGDTQASVAFAAPTNTGGTTITGYTVTVSPAHVAPVNGAGSPIVVSGLTNGQAYTFTVTADNSAGTGPASSSSNSVTPAATQTITFNNPGAQNFGTTPTLTATSDSGLTPTFTSSTTGVCTITTGGVLTFVTVGTCTINADQAGNSSYLAATQVSRSFTVNAVVPGAPTIGTATAGNTQATVAFTAPASNGGATITGYTVTANPGGATQTGASSPITFTGLTNGTSYTFTVEATNSVGTGSVSGASNTVTPKGPQTISFGQPADQILGNALAVSATATSGLTPVFSSATTAVCTVTSSGVVTLVATGTCTLHADQAGDTSYLAATRVTRSFSVNPVPNSAPVITQGATTLVTMSEDGTPNAFALSLTATDANSDPLTWSISSQASEGTASVSSGLVSYVPSTNFHGSDSFVVRVTDGEDADTITVNVTVAPVNDKPEIAGVASTSINEGDAYSFTPDASDVDTGDILTFNIVNKPVWASFDSATGELSGNPTNADVGVTTGVVISVSDGTVSASLAPFDVTVVNVNAAPVISGVPATSVNQDVAYSFIPLAVDDDSVDMLTFSIINKPSWASFDPVTGALTGVPANADVGTTTGILISVSDGVTSAELAAFDLTVVNVNEAPVISGAPATSIDQDVAYSFTPTASDSDLGDSLTFSITNMPTWASFNTATGALTGTPSGTDTGITTGIVISVSDGTISASLPAFNLEIVSTIDPMQPVVTAPADLDINAYGLFTPVHLTHLIGLGINATPEEINAILSKMASDGVSGNNCCVAIAEGLNAANTILLAPGRHEIKWKATNAVGVTGEAIQVINIKPIVSLSKSQIAVRGSSVEFKVLLNGPSPVYPLSIPYVIDPSTTATGAEHNLVSGTATFTQAGQLEVVIPVALAGVSGFSDSQLVVGLGSGINAGAANRHVIDIRQGNVPPVVSLAITQGGVDTSLITTAGGPVTVTATVSDSNTGDTHTFDWSATSGLADTDGNPANAIRVFDPTGLNGSHQVQVTVTDSGGASVRASTYFRVIASLPVLDINTDTDQDGVNDSLEGTGDTDDNGIPDYLDNMPSTNILPQQGNTTNAYLIECDPGVRCGLGLFARSGASGGVQILDQEIGTLDDLVFDPAFEPVGGVFDFAIRDLPTPGQSVRVVVPQRSAIPANAVYRKYQRGAWVSFVSDADNAIHSALGSLGYCPPPGSADWTPGLTAGHLCVQLTIEDGGPNDDDGLVNSAVVDPGAVSVAVVVEPPEPPKPPVKVNSKGSGSLGGLWIALLGGLLMFRKLKHRHWLALAALLASQSQAQQLENIYVRADIFSAESTREEKDFNGALTAEGHEFSIGKYDADRTGFQLAIGYNWNKVTYTQFGYLDLGEVQVNLLLDGDADQDAFAADLADEYPITATGVTLVQGVKYGFGDHFNLGFEAGVYLWEGEVDVNGVPFSIDEDSGTDPIVGLLLDLPLGDSFSLGVGVRRVFFSEQEVNLYSFGSSYHF